jgi:hypothetical protein
MTSVKWQVSNDTSNGKRRATPGAQAFLLCSGRHSLPEFEEDRTAVLAIRLVGLAGGAKL